MVAVVRFRVVAEEKPRRSEVQGSVVYASGNRRTDRAQVCKELTRADSPLTGNIWGNPLAVSGQAARRTPDVGHHVIPMTVL